MMDEWSRPITYLDFFTNYNDIIRRNDKMDYDDFYYRYGAKELKGKLKPITCPACKDSGMPYCGSCEKCLKNRAYNKEWLDTHSFIADKKLRGYHYDGHNPIKQLPLRQENEHPYLYYGIELEVEFDYDSVDVNADDDDYDDGDEWRGSNRINEILAELSDITDGMFIYECDGSLDNGVECISRPMSYATWTHPDTVKRLKDGLEYLKSMGALVRQPEGNGLHIHISRQFFKHKDGTTISPTPAYQRFEWLFQKFQPEIEQIGGRRYTEFCESKVEKLRKNLSNNIRLNYNVEGEIKVKMKPGGEIPEGDHYSSVNSTRHTIEARVFHSTIDYKQLLSCIEMVRNFAHAVRDGEEDSTLNEILHSKDNLYLDAYLAKVSRDCRKNSKEFDLEKKATNEIEVSVKINSLA